MPSPHDLLTMPLTWRPVFSAECSYCTEVDGTRATLQINADFPGGGPFYRLEIEDASLEFDDAPSCWVLPAPPDGSQST